MAAKEATVEKNRLRQLLLALPIPVVLIAADFLVRGQAIAKLPLDFKAYYLSSILFVVFFWYGALTYAKHFWQRGKAWGIGYIFSLSLLATLIVLTAFAFFDHFAVLPNVFVFEYIIDEPHDCLLYLESGLKLGYLAAVSIVVAGLGAYIAHASRRPVVAAGRRDLIVNALVLVVGCMFFHNNVRMGPNAFTPEIHSIFSLTKAAEDSLAGSEHVQVVGYGVRTPIETSLGPLPHNVLLILNESLRANSLSAYGYFRDTTPNLKQLFSERAGSMIRFDHAYANATRTMVAFPSYFAGVVPSQTGALLHRVPLVFDYGRTFSNDSTFFISTQSMHWGNFDRFLGLDRLDFTWYKENSQYANTEADRFESLDDKYLPAAFGDFLAKRQVGKKFFGVIQLTNTHAPYGFDAEDDLWHDSRLTNSYDNSIHYHDRQFGRIIKMLKDQGLLADTLIISTSDHGEAFGEHGYYGHLNTFYDEEARVPMWIHLPDKLASDRRLVAQLRRNAQDSVSNADIIPTLVSLLARDHFKALAPTMKDLTGAALDRPLADGRAIMMQNYNDIDEKTMFVGLGVVYGHYKYLLKFNQSVAEEELYDLAADPTEQHNVWESASPELKRAIYGNIRKHKNSNELFIKASRNKAGHT